MALSQTNVQTSGRNLARSKTLLKCQKRDKNRSLSAAVKSLPVAPLAQAILAQATGSSVSAQTLTASFSSGLVAVDLIHLF